MASGCRVCDWRTSIACVKCGNWCITGEREVVCKKEKGVLAFGIRCLHCGFHNFFDDTVAKTVILPEILESVGKKYEWEHPV